MRLGELLPLVQSFGDAVAASAAKVAGDQGKRVSCAKGCGACCRQLVPVAEVEARRLAALVRELPEPRRTEVRARFAAARRRLEAAGLLGELRHAQHEWSEEALPAFGLAYFRQGIPCPFLEDESCSVYADRPLVCREYLVTSPPADCAQPTAETVDRVPMPFKVWTALARFDRVPPGARFIRWVPLVLAPEWAEAGPEEPAARPGPELLSQFFEHVTGQKAPPRRAPVHELPAPQRLRGSPGSSQDQVPAGELRA
jgi:Fe-S-cluster containining protein